MADKLEDRRTRAFGRRAKLRKRAIADMKDPETTGPESDVASLVWVGMPAGAVEKGVAKFAPKGFKMVKKAYKPSKEFLEGLSRKVHKLKPVLGKMIKK